MGRTKWLLQIWFMWHVIKIIKTQSAIGENEENIFTILKYPTANRVGDIIKYLPKICYNDDEDDEDEQRGERMNGTMLTTQKDNSFEILKMLKNIVQHLQKPNCRKTKSFLITASMMTKTTTMPQVKNVMATSERSLVRANNKDSQQQQQQKQGQQQHHREKGRKQMIRVGIKPFSILEQLKLDGQTDEEEEQQQEEEFHEQDVEQQEQHQQLDHSDPENLLQLQQMQNMQQILETLKTQNLAKATKKKKKKKKKKKPTKKKKPPKKKKKKRKKTKKKPFNHTPPLVGQPAHVLIAQSFKPQFHQQHQQHYQQQHHDHYNKITTTKKPQQLQHHHPHFKPLKKIKYILRKNTIFKKKKKEYLNHLKHVFYPFVKFIAFFTILNPFTLAVFLFSLISPVVFGFLGFIGLSFLIKPALHLLFGVKRTVNSINRKKLLEHHKRERLRQSRRPITIHKHYYQQRPIAPPPPKSKIPQRYQHPSHHHRHSKYFNPILPHVRHKLTKDLNGIPNLKGYHKTYP